MPEKPTPKPRAENIDPRQFDNYSIEELKLVISSCENIIKAIENVLKMPHQIIAHYDLLIKIAYEKTLIEIAERKIKEKQKP